MKLLTISIAAYNVEKYIVKTLDSLADRNIIDQLEIFIVDDGGTDGTLKIASQYAKKYPDSFFAIHKENDGYGSTVNYSITHATGKYFRLLDGDDWVETENLVSLIKVLKDCDADVVVNDYYKCPENEGHTLVNVCSAKEPQQKPILSWSIPRPFGMWAITYKTELLRKANLVLPLHCLYTDRIYATVPLAYARDICCLPFPIYCYRLGRDGQSVSRESRIKHFEDTLLICKNLCIFYEEQKQERNPNTSLILSQVALRHYLVAIRTLLLLPVNKGNLERVRLFEHQTKMLSKDIYLTAAQNEHSGKTGKLLKFMRATNYLPYWMLKLIPKSFLDF